MTREEVDTARRAAIRIVDGVSKPGSIGHSFAAKCVAKTLLAMLPPDDDEEPANREWVAGHPSVKRFSYMLQYTDVPLEMLFNGKEKETWWIEDVEIWGSQTVTRGMVRRLIAALKGNGTNV